MGCLSVQHRNGGEHLRIILNFATGGLQFGGIWVTLEGPRLGESEECNLSAEHVTIQLLPRRERTASPSKKNQKTKFTKINNLRRKCRRLVLHERNSARRNLTGSTLHVKSK